MTLLNVVQVGGSIICLALVVGLFRMPFRKSTHLNLPAPRRTVLPAQPMRRAA